MNLWAERAWITMRTDLQEALVKALEANVAEV